MQKFIRASAKALLSIDSLISSCSLAVRAKQDQVALSMRGSENVKSDHESLLPRLKEGEKSLRFLHERKESLIREVKRLREDVVPSLKQKAREALDSRDLLIKSVSELQSISDRKRTELQDMSQESIRVSKSIAEESRGLFFLKQSVRAAFNCNNKFDRCNNQRNDRNQGVEALSDSVTIQIESLEERLRLVLSQVSSRNEEVQSEERMGMRVGKDMDKLARILEDVDEKLKLEKKRGDRLVEKHKWIEAKSDKKRKKIIQIKSEISQLTCTRLEQNVEDGGKMPILSDAEIDRFDRESREVDRDLAMKEREYSRMLLMKNNVEQTCQGVSQRVGGLDVIVTAQESEKVKLTALLGAIERENDEKTTKVGRTAHARETLILILRGKRECIAKLNEDCEREINLARVISAQDRSVRGETQRIDRELLSYLHDIEVRVSNLNKAASLQNTIEETECHISHEKQTILKIQAISQKRVNVHRWSRLLQTSPQKLSEIQRLHALQQELLHMQESLVMFEKRIANKRRILQEMRKLECPDFIEKVKQAIRFYRMQKSQLKKNMEILVEERSEVGFLVDQLLCLKAYC